MNPLAQRRLTRGLPLALLLLCVQTARAYDWLPPTNKVTVLAVWAHPDDEGIFGGGTLPYYAAVLKVPTMMVCLTDGNMNPSDFSRDDELRCAAWSYGVRYEPIFGHFLSCPTQTLTNNPYTNTIDMTWDYWAGVGYKGDGSDVELGKQRTINYIAEQIRRYRPDVIITHDVNGEYGHDNHKAVAWATTNAFFVAADPNATGTNLVGLAPWQAQKLYVHLWPGNRLFHPYWEMPFVELTNQTVHQLANIALLCHASQYQSGMSSVYPPYGGYYLYPSEWWGLYASTVGPDTVLSSSAVVNGYLVPSGVALGNFLQNVVSYQVPPGPAFVVNPITLPPLATGDSCTGQSIAAYAVASLSYGSATAPTQPSYSKVSGPAWLSVGGADGSLTGAPANADAGTNSWSVAVTDASGAGNQTTLTVNVVPRLPGLENLIAWWKLDETASSNPSVVVDSAPLAANGAPYGPVVFGQGGARSWTGTSAQFDGVSAKVDVPYSGALNPPTFTVALWAKVTGGSGAYRSPLTSRQSSPVAGYMFYAGGDNHWQFRTGNGSAWTVLTAGLVVNNVWMHLAATYDGAVARFYTNGALAASANTVIQPNNQCPLRIGAGATESNGSYYFPGFIDDVRVYRVALDAAGVGSLYSHGPPAINSIQPQSNGTIQLAGTGLAGQPHILLVATNLSAPVLWIPVLTNVADANGAFQFADLWTTSSAARFYMVSAP